VADKIMEELIKIYESDKRVLIPKLEVMELLVKINMISNMSDMLESFGLDVRGLVSQAKCQ
jgi:hypothetical protein